MIFGEKFWSGGGRGRVNVYGDVVPGVKVGLVVESVSSVGMFLKIYTKNCGGVASCTDRSAFDFLSRVRFYIPRA